MQKPSNIPEDPGCYLYKDSLGVIIYVGKAKSLRKRVSSYFQKKDHDPKTALLVSAIDSVDYIVTKNEAEALILENNLIKRHKPKFNIDLRDSKRYAFIILTDEPYPKLMIARDRLSKGIYFGPFVSAEKRDAILRFAIDTFRLRTCKLKSKRPCLRYQMGRCSGACVGKVSEEDYNRSIEDVKAFLMGRSKDLIKDLRARMSMHAANQEYEQAKMIRDQVDALSFLEDSQNMERQKNFDQDVINYLIMDGEVNLVLFHIYKGTLSEKQEFVFSYNEEFLEEFMLQYYLEEKIPKEIIIPQEVSQSLVDILGGKLGQKLIVTIPEKGDKHDLLLLARKNLEIAYGRDELAVKDLRDKLDLAIDPDTIECFDISHISGSSSVGSMVSFSGGRPDKSNYRRFRIRTIEGIDDFAMMAEVVTRRYSRLLREGAKLPDLIIVDGGKGQLSSAVSVLTALNVSVPIIALAKREEEVFYPHSDEPLLLDKRSEALKLLQRIRDEAHRFAVSYHKVLRKKRIIKEKNK